MDDFIVKTIEKHNRLAIKLYEQRHLYTMEEYDRKRKRIFNISNELQKRHKYGIHTEK